MNRSKNVSYNIYIVAIALSVPFMLVTPARAQSEKGTVGGTTTSGAGTTAGAALTSPSTASAPAATPGAPAAPRKKIVFTPGMEFSIGTANETIRVTNDSKVARAQVDKSPDSPEAHFVYAVSLTRTSQVEEALKEIRTARKLSSLKGGAVYFDQMIGEYEEMLKNYPEDNQIRYHLAWAYYMKAYVLARYSKQVAQKPATLPAVAVNNAAPAAGKPEVAKLEAGKTEAGKTDAAKTEATATATAEAPAGQPKNWQSEFVAQNSVLKPEELLESESEPSNKGTAATSADAKGSAGLKAASEGTAATDQSAAADSKKSKKKKKDSIATSESPTDSKVSKDNKQAKVASGADSKDYVNLGEETPAVKTEAKAPGFTPPTVPPANATAHGGGKGNFWANPLGNIQNLGPITGMEYATANAAPEVIPQVKAYYRRALKKLDEVIEREPDDMFANLYRAHLKAEYSGDIDSAMKVWESCRDAHPNSPAPYFFLGEGYLKKGNLGQCLTNVSKAIALRSTGN
ncbi:MAG: hypothetical protein SGJ27_20495 [Candidatus Melainabacteria bacterium]|nr:hypothetical protein [Candidatus Melainabacteria bacterium]